MGTSGCIIFIMLSSFFPSIFMCLVEGSLICIHGVVCPVKFEHTFIDLRSHGLGCFCSKDVSENYIEDNKAYADHYRIFCCVV